MQIKDVLYRVAVHIGNRDLGEEILTGRANGDATAEELLAYYNEVEKEIACDYFPLIAERSFEVTNERIAYVDFDKTPSSIKKVLDGKGNKLKFSFYASYLKVPNGKTTVLYSYLPEDKGLTDIAEVFYGVTELILVSGILKNYYLTRGMLQESGIWNKTYYEALHSAMVTAERGGRMAARKWA